ncbi:hypothetical protein CR513_39709, partial [Mucuna pruriens]
MLVNGQLYRQGISYPLLKCLGEEEIEHAIKEVHEGACGTHTEGRALADKIAQASFYWLTLKKDCLAFFCAQYGIRQSFMSVEHLQTNSQAKVANNPKGNTKTVKGSEGKMGRGTFASALILPHHVLFNYARISFSTYIRSIRYDPNRG